MDTELKQRWVEALRSDKYKQGRKRLRNPDYQDEFCCLGVLADLIDPEAWHGHLWYTEYLGCETSLPLDILPRGVQNQLMLMNDRPSSSFTEIADYIEAKNGI